MSEKERILKRNYKAKLKQNYSESTSNKPIKRGYATPQSKGKAVKRVLRFLPKSPTVQKFVL